MAVCVPSFNPIFLKAMLHTFQLHGGGSNFTVNDGLAIKLLVAGKGSTIVFGWASRDSPSGFL